MSKISIKSFYVEKNLKTGTSEIKNYNDLNKIITNFIKESAYTIAYLDYKVLIGKFENDLSFKNQEIFDTKYLQKIRVFNKSSELIIFKKNDKTFGYRFIEDSINSSKEVNVIESYHILWGTKSRILDNNYSLLSESRGIELKIPFELDITEDNNKNAARVAVRVRNYIDYDENTYQAEYCDSRMLDFWLIKNGEIIEELK